MEPLTLFGFCERIARLREAQRHFDMLSSEYSARQVVPLAYEVDALIVRARVFRLYPEFLKFVDLVAAMRAAQRTPGAVAEAERLSLESSVDAAVALHVVDAKCLNELLRDQDMPVERAVIANNAARRGGKGAMR